MTAATGLYGTLATLGNTIGTAITPAFGGTIVGIGALGALGYNYWKKWDAKKK